MFARVIRAKHESGEWEEEEEEEEDKVKGRWKGEVITGGRRSRVSVSSLGSRGFTLNVFN